MKRLHVHIAVEDLQQSVGFYKALFGAEPTKLKDDYAKWMLDDPAVNFAISTRSESLGVDHLGIQVDDDAELAGLRDRLNKADMQMFDEGETVCCYSRSDKSWVKDPTNIAWEAYQNMEDAQVFNSAPASKEDSESSCCAPKSAAPKSSCC